MLKTLHINNSMPASFPLDPTAEFQGGMIAQLKVIGNDIVVGVSDGTAPLGIIDDVRTNAFSKQQIDEIVEIQVTATNINTNGEIVNSENVTGTLEFPIIDPNSFISTIDVTLNATNGIVTVEAGTPLNYDFDGDGTYDGFRIIVNYTYRIATKPGDDSTIGSNRVTVHYARGFYATDQFDPKQQYPLNATLFVGLDGKLTTKQATTNHPGIAVVTGPPSAINSMLELFYL